MMLQKKHSFERKGIFTTCYYLYLIYTLPGIFKSIQYIYNYMISSKMYAHFFNLSNKFLYIIDTKDIYLSHSCPYLNVKPGLHEVFIYKGDTPLCPGQEQEYYQYSLMYALLIYTWGLITLFLSYELYNLNKKKEFIYIKKE